MKRLPASKATLAVSFILLFFIGCAAKEPMPAFNMQSSDWQIWTGQAEWFQQGRDVVAGDILLALDERQNVYVQLSSNSLLIFRAQTHKQRWRLERLAEARVDQGKGEPPEAFIWFYLPVLLGAGELLPSSDWQMQRTEDDRISIQHIQSGERIALSLDEPLL